MTNITMYSKGYCPFCKAAKNLLKSKGLDYQEIDVTTNPVEFANMVERSNRRTVPQVFVGDIHIGGFDDLAASFASNSFPLNKVTVA